MIANDTDDKNTDDKFQNLLDDNFFLNVILGKIMLFVI
jgi:hypothetical protein